MGGPRDLACMYKELIAVWMYSAWPLVVTVVILFCICLGPAFAPVAVLGQDVILRVNDETTYWSF